MGLFTKRAQSTITDDEISDEPSAEQSTGGSAQSSFDDRVVQEMDAALSAETLDVETLDALGPIDDIADEDVTQQFNLPAPVSAVAPASQPASQPADTATAPTVTEPESPAAEPAPATAAPEIDLSALSDAQLATLVRTRLASRDAIAHIATDYAVSIAGDLVALLDIEQSGRIEPLTDETLEGRDIDALFAAGLASVMADPIDQVQQAAPGIALFVGQSPFTATKVLGMPQLIADHLAAEHHGVLFGVPNRHLVFAVALTDMPSLQSTGTLAELVADQASAEGNPGGALSSDIFLWRAGLIERVGGMDETGAVHMYGGPLMQDVLEELSTQA